VGDPLLIQIVGFAIRRRRKYLLWQCVCQPSEACNTLRDGKFTLPAVRNVDSHAVHETGLACLPRTRFTPRGDYRTHIAIRPETSKLSLARLVMSQAFLQSVRDSLTIVRVDCLQKSPTSHLGSFGNPEHLLATFRPDEFIVGTIPLPCANVGALHRKLELFLLLS